MFGRMGGFQLITPSGKSNLRGNQFMRRVKGGAIEVPDIKEGLIRDRSKSDDIAKAIVLIQTLWFAIQAANRVNQGLTVTEFEITTLGHVVISIIISWCWWNKPLNVEYPIEVYPRHHTEDEKVSGEGNQQPGGSAERGKEKDLESQVAMPQHLSLRMRISTSTYDVIEQGLRAVRPLGWRSWRPLSVIVCFSIIGGAFGAVHCLAWNSVFPSRIEHIFWRVSALIVTVAPGLIFALYVFDSSWDIEDTLKTPFVAPLMVVYCIARASLLILALIALRSLPYKAYVIPSWSSYVPHIG